MGEKFDVIVVGAGVCGLSAAYTLAAAGLKTIVIDRGLNPGSKNVMGGVLYRHAMEELIPDFWKEAPLERPIVEQSMWLMDKESVIKNGYKDNIWANPPHNCYTVFRGKFDQWFAKKCVDAGVLIISETVAKNFLFKNDKVIGVQTDRPQGDIYADVVIVADGVNSLLSKQLGFHKEWKSKEVALVVMEVLKLPAAKIEERFNLNKGMGATIEVFGDSTMNMLGTSYIYTHKEHLSIGSGVLLSQLSDSGLKPYNLLEYFKKNPMIMPLLEGAEPVEYYAHLIPEGGYRSIPKLYGNGVLVAGDAAQMVNSIHREGSNLAMMSGRLAAETAIIANRLGEFSERALSKYEEMLKDSFVIKDLRKYKDAAHVIAENKHYFGTYVPLANRSIRQILTVDGTSKRAKQWEILKDAFKTRSLLKTFWDIIKLLKALI